MLIILSPSCSNIPGDCLTDEDLDGYRKEEENTAVWSFCPGPRAGCRPMKVFLNTELCEAGTLSLCSTEDTETPIS